MSKTERTKSHHQAIRLIAIVVALVITATACSATVAETSSVGVNSSSAQSTTSESTTDASTSESAPAGDAKAPPVSNEAAVEPAAASRGLVEVFALGVHPSGAQVYIDSINATAESTIVSGRAFNGRDFRSTFSFDNADSTTLVDDQGRSYPLIAGADFRVEQGDIASFEVSFAPLESDGVSVDLQLHARADDERSIEEGSPGFVVETINLDAPEPEPALPADLGFEDVGVHPNGSSLKVQGIAFTDTHIGVGFVGTNTDNSVNRFSVGHHASFLEDDLGNRYWLKFEGDNRQLNAEGNSEVSGVLVFGGRIDPDAQALTLVTNVDESESDARESSPRFSLGPWPLDGSFEGAAELAPLTVDDTVAHPNGTSFSVTGLGFDAAGTTVALTVLNNSGRQIFVNAPGDGTYLLDDLDNRYLINAPSDNGSLKIPSDSGIEGSFSFPGQLDPNASSLELVFNDASLGGGLDTETPWPEVTLGPWQLTRSAGGAAAIVAPPTGFGERTTWVAGTVEVSEAAGLELIFSEFDGIEIAGGVQLTLPEGILFDSGQSTLRAGSRESINKIVQIFEFYEGDPITVVGHTDSEGSDAFNQSLSQDRAAEVVASLIAAGGPAALLSTDGRGESDPIADNATEAGRQTNRRVEIVIFTDKGLPR